MAVLFFLLLLFLSFVSPAVSQTPLTLNERIQAQEKIERVYYDHRIWPDINKFPKPFFEQMVPRSVIEKKVNDSLSVRITSEMLQAEMDRIAKTTKDPAMLQELFSALNNDPFLVAETLVRSSLADRMIHGENFASIKKRMKNLSLKLPKKNNQNCEGWELIDASNPPEARTEHTAVWTGTEMIVWGGFNPYLLNTGGRYDPVLNTWTPTSTGANVPQKRWAHSAVWTGSEMIVWGGYNFNSTEINDGGRYDPVTDTWIPTPVSASVPAPRYHHSAIWTGTEMIIWGGEKCCSTKFNSGGRYNPSTNSWQPTSIGTNVPEPRTYHSAIWTGQEMIVWGGRDDTFGKNSGGKYDPVSNSWLPTSLVNAPHFRWAHTAVWTGDEMIIWGGYFETIYHEATNSGAIYNPLVDEWQQITSVGAPSYRACHTAVWTGTEMIIWGGFCVVGGSPRTSTGGRYLPASDSWSGTALGSNVPSKRAHHTSIWTGSKMMIFGGNDSDIGGIYSPETDKIAVIPSSLPNAEVGVPYYQTISATNGLPPYTLALVEDS